MSLCSARRAGAVVPQRHRLRPADALVITIEEPGVYGGQCAEFCGEAHSLMGIRVVAQNEADFQAWVNDWRTPAPTANAPEVAAAPDADAAPAGSGPNAAGADASPQEAANQTALPSEEASGEAAMDPLVARGRQVFFRESTCVLCHAIEGTPAPGVIGPNLTRMGRRTTIAAGMLENTRENLELWLRDPVGVKPGAEMPGADYPGVIGGITYPATNLNDEQIEALAAYLSSMR